MSHPLSCCVIGAGRMGRRYGRALEASQEVNLVAVVDSQQESAHALAREFGGTGFRSLQALQHSGPPVDFTIVCAPPNVHHSLTLESFSNGWHVLCEQPFSLSENDAREMIAASTTANRLLSAGSRFRFVDDVAQAKSMIEDGHLGEIVLFESVFSSFVDMSTRWNSDPRISGGGVLIDQGSQALDLTRYLFGPMTELQVLEGKRVQNLGVEDTVRINLRATNRGLGSIDLSWSVNRAQDAFYTVRGSEGTLILGWTESRYHRHAQGRWIPFGTGYDELASLRGQVENFARAIRGEEELAVDAEDGLASVQNVQAAYRSLHNFLWVTIPGVNVRSQPCACTVEEETSA